MAKSNYLSGILFLAALCLCGCAGSDNLVVGCWLPVVREGESLKLKAKSTRGVVSCLLPVVSKNVFQKEFDSQNGKKDQVHSKFYRPNADQRAKNQESGRAGFSMNKQIKNLQPITYNLQLQKYQEGVFLGAESSYLITGNRQLTTDFRLQQLTTRFQQLTTKRIYDSQIGVREHGFNAGPEVEKYLRYVNLGRGQPWCAAFICWVYGQAGVDNPRSGWTPDLFREKNVIWRRAESKKLKAKSKKQYRAASIRYQDEISLVPMSFHPTTNNRQPTTGDIFALFFPEKNRIAHAGFIDQWDDTWLITVEGNTNLSGSREGDGVYRKRRLVRSVYQVARYIREQ